MCPIQVGVGLGLGLRAGRGRPLCGWKRCEQWEPGEPAGSGVHVTTCILWGLNFLGMSLSGWFDFSHIESVSAYLYMCMHYGCTIIYKYVYACVCVLFATLWAVAQQASLSMGFPRKEYLSGLDFLLQQIFPPQGSNLSLLRWQADFFTTESWGKPGKSMTVSLFLKNFLSFLFKCNIVVVKYYIIYTHAIWLFGIF